MMITYAIRRPSKSSPSGFQYVRRSGFTSQPSWAQRFDTREAAEQYMQTVKGRNWIVVSIR